MSDMSDQASQGRPDSSPACVLVVEDELLIQMLAVEFLEELGLAAETADSAAAAKSKLAALRGEVAAVLIDIGLPDTRGDVLFGELRAIYPNLPVVIASGHSVEALRNQFKDQPAMAFLGKPYAPEQMRTALRAVGVLT
jgi:DNA-binding NtrC family response regulator